jgi:hypothetical protein
MNIAIGHLGWLSFLEENWKAPRTNRVSPILKNRHLLTLCSEYPLTSGFSSFRYSQVIWARDFPRQLSSRKKFIPRSFSVTTVESWIVKLPTAGRIRFLRVSTPTAPGSEFISKTCAFSSACWPLTPHSRS